MKKLFLIAVIAISSIQAKAQVQYGIQAHGVLSTASISDDSGYEISKDSRFGFGVGLFADFTVSPEFSIKPSLNYLQKGVEVSAAYEEENMSIEENIEANLNYLELPVLFNYRPSWANGAWFIGAGPSIGYGLSGKLNSSYTMEDETESFEIDAFKDEEEDGGGFKRFEFSVMAATGFHLSENLGLQVSYLYGISNLLDDSEENGEFKNRSLLLSLSYAF